MVSSTPRPHFTPRKDPVPIVQEAGWAPRAGLDGQKISSPPGFDPGPSSPLYRLSYWAHKYLYYPPPKKKRQGVLHVLIGAGLFNSVLTGHKSFTFFSGTPTTVNISYPAHSVGKMYDIFIDTRNL